MLNPLWFQFRTFFTSIDIDYCFCVGSKEGCCSSSKEEGGEDVEGGESTVREAAKTVWYRWGSATEEGCNKEREMASECYPPKEEEDSQDAIEGPSCSQPVHQNPR